MIQHVLSIWGMWQFPGEGFSFSAFSVLRNKDDTLPYKTNHSSLQDYYDLTRRIPQVYKITMIKGCQENSATK